jgi:hypothetical protein
MFGRYVLGLVLGAIAIAALGGAARSWRRNLLPGWKGAPARLAEAVMVLAAVVCISEVLGVSHQFRLGPIEAAFVVVGLVCWYLARRTYKGLPAAHVESSEAQAGAQRGAHSRARPNGRRENVVAVLVTAIVVADWSTRTVDAIHHGMTTVDTLWYHLPFAARWVQDGSIGPLHFVDTGNFATFFPASSEIFHAVGILFMGNDVLSLFLNTAWLALALLAGWCIGRPFGVPQITLIATAAVMATPGLVTTQPGGAYDDIVGLALLLAAVAILVSAGNSMGATTAGQIGVAAAAAGLAVGVKYTFLVPVAALTVGVIVWSFGKVRLPRSGLWLLVLFVTGSFWYLRNWVLVGNPLPSLTKLGPLRLPGPAAVTATQTVAHFLVNGHVWSAWYLPGLRLSLGPVWWLLLALVASGIVLGVLRGAGSLVRIVAVTGAVSIVAYLFTPQILTIVSVPVFFAVNLRYSSPGLVLGAIALPLAPLLRKPHFRWWLIGAFTVVVVATQFDASIWPTDLTATRFIAPVSGIDSIIGLLLGVLVAVTGIALVLSNTALDLRNPLLSAPLSLLAVVLLVVGGFELQQFYLTHRYTDSTIYSWGQRQQRARIGVYGFELYLQYPFYGSKNSNYVQYIGESGSRGSYTTITTCPTWRRVIDNYRFAYVVLGTNPVPHRAEAVQGSSPQVRWTQADPNARLLIRQISYVGSENNTASEDVVQPGFVSFSVFRINGALDPATCSP